MRLLYVDHVNRLHRLEAIEAVLLLSPDDSVFSVHFPGNPMLPASVQIEAFAQAASILLETSSGFTCKAFPAYLRDAKFHRPVRPSYPLEIRMDVEQWAEEGSLLRGRATQGGNICSVCTIGMVTAPLERFYHTSHASAYRAMYQRWLGEAVLVGFEGNPLDALSHVLAG